METLDHLYFFTDFPTCNEVMKSQRTQKSCLAVVIIMCRAELPLQVIHDVCVWVYIAAVHLHICIRDNLKNTVRINEYQ